MSCKQALTILEAYPRRRLITGAMEWRGDLCAIGVVRRSLGREDLLATHDVGVAAGMTLKQWARAVGLSREVIAYRLDAMGWCVDRALTTPKMRRRGIHG